MLREGSGSMLDGYCGELVGCGFRVIGLWGAVLVGLG